MIYLYFVLGLGLLAVLVYFERKYHNKSVKQDLTNNALFTDGSDHEKLADEDLKIALAIDHPKAPIAAPKKKTTSKKKSTAKPKKNKKKVM